MLRYPDVPRGRGRLPQALALIMKALGRPLQFACFACRKSFKRPQMSGSVNRFMLSEQQAAQQREANELNIRSYKCPDCGGRAHFMGIDFKAPKKSDAKAWLEVKEFIQSGRVYYRGSQSSVVEA